MADRLMMSAFARVPQVAADHFLSGVTDMGDYEGGDR